MFEENEGSIAGIIEAQASEANVYRERSVALVLTHGDITGRNMIQTAQGLKLVDWDEAMLAPAERDINFFYDNPNFSLDHYYECVGKDRARFDRRLMEYYGRQWVIESILENFEKLLAPIPESDKQEYLDEINQYIGYCSL
jgi:spectinomycin phosphotransferase/16S rRNA (guanine(1405)-N(7))-methyltransferase